MARGRKTGRQPIECEGAAKWKIGPYLRLSSEDERSGESESIANQQAIVDEFIESYIQEPYEIVDYFKDDGLTGTDDTREDFMRLISHIEQGKVNCVVCKTLARAFRNYSDQGYYLEYYFQQKKVRFITIGDPHIDTFTNPDALHGFEVPITGIVNDRYAARTSNDVRRTFNSKRKRGEFIGAFAPYGYLKDEKDKNHLVIDEEVAPLKRDILHWIVRDGMSWKGIARKLNEMGIPNPTLYKQKKGLNYQHPNGKTDGLWCAGTIKSVMLDPVNLGHMVQGRTRIISYKVHVREPLPESEWIVVKNTHEPTFSQEEYDTMINVTRRDTRTANDNRARHLLSGFVQCADCGLAMHRQAAKNIVYYKCRTYREKSKSACTRHAIREDAITHKILSVIQSQLQLLTTLETTIAGIRENPAVNTKSQRISKLLADKQNELQKTRRIADGLYADWKTEVISKDDYVRMKAMYDERIKSLVGAIVNLENEQSQMDTALTRENALFKTFLKYGSVQALDRGILSELIDVVLVHENKEITIKFRHADELARIVEVIEQNQALQQQ